MSQPYSNFYSKDEKPRVWPWVIALLLTIGDIIAAYKLCLYTWNDYLAVKYSLPAIDWIVVTVFLAFRSKISDTENKTDKTDKAAYYMEQAIARLIFYAIIAIIVSHGIAGLG